MPHFGSSAKHRTTEIVSVVLTLGNLEKDCNPKSAMDSMGEDSKYDNRLFHRGREKEQSNIREGMNALIVQ